jgi:hypothetical protein
VIEVRHADLTKLSDESDFKVDCPVCVRGVLLVRRNPETFNLMAQDNCCFCGQRFRYTDETIGHEPVVR